MRSSHAAQSVITRHTNGVHTHTVAAILSHRQCRPLCMCSSKFRVRLLLLLLPGGAICIGIAR